MVLLAPEGTNMVTESRMRRGGRFLGAGALVHLAQGGPCLSAGTQPSREPGVSFTPTALPSPGTGARPGLPWKQETFPEPPHASVSTGCHGKYHRPHGVNDRNVVLLVPDRGHGPRPGGQQGGPLLRPHPLACRLLPSDCWASPGCPSVCKHPRVSGCV